MLKDPLTVHIRLYFFNMVGQPVMKSVMQQNEMIVYRKDFTPGIYFYQIATTQGIVATGKMIVN